MKKFHMFSPNKRLADAMRPKRNAPKLKINKGLAPPKLKL